MSILPFLLGVLVSFVVVAPVLLRLRASLGRSRTRCAALETVVESARRGHAAAEEDHRSLVQFLKEFPYLARELWRGAAERQLPPILMNLVLKTFDPAQAVVLVRRGTEVSETGFVVAAVFPEGGSPRLGTDVSLDRGELGYVAESQLVTSREDLASDEARARLQEGPDALGGFPSALLAPLVFDQQTLGMVVLSRPRRASGDPKAALRLIAQTGAQALDTAAAFSRVRITAEMDALTHVFNKHHMEHSLAELIQRTTRSARTGAGQSALAACLFDIDHFRHYNETNGHLPGDKLLQELARVVQDSVRKDDIFGRIGGEEFLLILPNTSAEQALGAANKVRAAVAARRFPFAERQPMAMMSVSGGVAQFPEDGKDVASLLEAASAALHEAKRQGRNRVVAASHGSHA
jgi:diguanylate cyclase (GGDEF)-like protein